MKLYPRLWTLTFLVFFAAHASEQYVHAVAEKNANELTIFAHVNEVVYFQTVMPEKVKAQVIEGSTCAVESPLRRLVGRNKVTTEARIVPYTMGDPTGNVCRVHFTDGTFQNSVRILYHL